MINYDRLKEEYEKIAGLLSTEDVLKDRDQYQKLTKRFSFLEKIVKLIKAKEQYLKEQAHLNEVISSPHEEEAIRQMAQEELKELKSKIEKLDENIEDSIFSENEPQRDVIIEIRSAAGGEEAALFVADLYRMYSRYAESKGWKLEVLGSHITEIGGYKEISFSVKGDGAYTHLKFESGVHRVQRVPVTEASGRIHTSTVTVAVLIEPKDIEISINPEELKIDTFRSSGAGGQHVNVTDSAVRITHIPTGTIVTCQDERSQIKNRAKAMRVLKARIMEKMRDEEEGRIVEARRVQVGTGDRSEKIRTYNFPERRVTDHRINFTIYRLEAVLQGDMDEIVSNLIKAERHKIYQTKGLI